MKKTYQIPEMEMTNVELQRMIAASEEVKLGGNYDGTSQVESRRRSSLWDDDEYDEF